MGTDNNLQTDDSKVQDQNLNNDNTADQNKDVNLDANPNPADGTRPSWANQLPDDLKSNEKLTGFATIGELAKAFIKQDGNLNGSIKVPGEDASDEEKAAFKEALGIPDNPDGYEFDKQDLPEGMEYSEDMEQQFRVVFADLNISKAQALGLSKAFNNMQVAAHNTQQAEFEKQTEECNTALRQKWASDYEKNSELAHRALERFGSKEYVELMTQTGLGDDPRVLFTWHEIGKAMSEDTFIQGERSAQQGRKGLSYPNTKY